MVTRDTVVELMDTQECTVGWAMRKPVLYNAHFNSRLLCVLVLGILPRAPKLL